jgi:hypothetical protein
MELAAGEKFRKVLAAYWQSRLELAAYEGSLDWSWQHTG